MAYDPTATAKHELRQYRFRKTEIDRIDRYLVQPGLQDGRFAELKSRKQLLLAQCLETERRLRLLPPFERAVLTQRYMHGVSWEAIAQMLGCDAEQTAFIHGRGLKLYSKNGVTTDG